MKPETVKLRKTELYGLVNVSVIATHVFSLYTLLTRDEYIHAVLPTDFPVY